MTCFDRLAAANRPCPAGKSQQFQAGWAAATMAVVRGDSNPTPPASASADWQSGFRARVRAK